MAYSCGRRFIHKFPSHLGVRNLITVQKFEKPLVIVGVVENEEKDKCDLTPTGHKVDVLSGGRLSDLLSKSGEVLKAGSSRYLGEVHQDLGNVIAVGLGASKYSVNEEEQIDEGREAVRNAAAAGIRAALELKASDIKMDDFGDEEASAEGSMLANWVYQEFKSEKKALPTVTQFDQKSGSAWGNGIILGSCQNLARTLMEAPANFLTPSQFCLEVQREMEGLPVEIIVRDEEWAKQKSMGSFLSVSRGSHEPAKFLELHYRGGGDAQPVVLVGKGVTFDTGGISIKPSAKMDAMRADMGGAATVVATMKAVSSLQLGVNLVVLVPLTENMPGGLATKPGDVVKAMNGITIQVDNTDAEGRLILADALCYAESFNPRKVLDVATLTGAMSVALGTGATGVFSKSTEDYNSLAACGIRTGDRVWRMPLWKTYANKMKNSPLADLNNISLTPGAGSCTAAGFLSRFTTCSSWMHLDIAGVMSNEGEVKYLGKGMSGRPTRTIVKFIESSSG